VLLSSSGLGAAFVRALFLPSRGPDNIFLQHQPRIQTQCPVEHPVESILFWAGACVALTVDLVVTGTFLVYGFSPWCSKLFAFTLTLILLFPS